MAPSTFICIFCRAVTTSILVVKLQNYDLYFRHSMLETHDWSNTTGIGYSWATSTERKIIYCHVPRGATEAGLKAATVYSLSLADTWTVKIPHTPSFGLTFALHLVRCISTSSAYVMITSCHMSVPGNPNNKSLANGGF